MASNFTLKEIRSLLEMLESHEVTEFRLTRSDERLWLRRGENQNVSQPSVQHILTQAPSAVPQVQQAPAPVAAPAPAPTPAAAPTSNGSAEAAAPSAPLQQVAAPAGKPLQDIASPMVGTFYRRPAVDAEPYVEVGDSVKKGDVLCIVEAMKLMNEIECDMTGRIAEVCLEDGQMVEYGEVLFRIEKS